MKLTDKRFWEFEAIVLICTIICIFILWMEHWLELFGLAFLGFCCLMLVGGAVAWKLYKGNQWWKLAGYLFLITTALLVIVLFSFVWDWNDNGGRPANIPPDEGCYITANELVGIIMLLWTIFAPILSCVISYIAKRWIMADKQPNIKIIDSAHRAVKGSVQPNVRAIAIGYRNNRITLKCYLDSLPSEQDREMLSDIAGEILSDFPPDRIPRITEICEFSNAPIPELDKLNSFIYLRPNEQ